MAIKIARQLTDSEKYCYDRIGWFLEQYALPSSAGEFHHTPSFLQQSHQDYSSSNRMADCEGTSQHKTQIGFRWTFAPTRN